MSLRAVKGTVYLRLLDYMINLSKQLFLITVEQGDNVLIPPEFSQRNLSMCYTFYDPVLRIVYDQMRDDRREFYGVKTKMKLERIHDKDIWGKLLKLIGVHEDEENRKLKMRHQVINDLNKKTTDPTTTARALNLQRSRYIAIETDINSLEKQYFMEKKF